VGRAESCDVVVDDVNVRPLHLRILARRRGSYQIHGVSDDAGRPYERRGSDEWVDISAGDRVEIGTSVFRIESGVPDAVEPEAG
jgi:predicted component of type VI protein secretion system